MTKVTRPTRVFLATAILLAGAAFRTVALADVPPGLTHDEAGHGHDAAAILRGVTPVYFTVGYGREPLYDYLNAGLMALLGPWAFALRLGASYFGLIALALTCRFAAKAFGNPAALVAGGLMAVSLWPVATGRQALRSGLLPVWTTVGALAFLHLLGARGRMRLVAAGVICIAVAASLYTYIPARILWVVFPTTLALIAIGRRPAARTGCLPVTVALAVAGLLSAPLFVYLQRNPAAEQRLEMLDEPLQALARGDLAPIVSNATATTQAFALPGRGDDFLAYNIPGRPVFDPLTALAFAAGLAVCAWKWRRPANALALAWLAIGVSPALVTGPAALTTRIIGAQPAIYALAGLGAASALTVVGRLRLVPLGAGNPTVRQSDFTAETQSPQSDANPARRERIRSVAMKNLRALGVSAVRGAYLSVHSRRVAPGRTSAGRLVPVLALTWIALVAVGTARDYFVRWGQSVDVRAAYMAPLRAMVEEAAAYAPGEHVVVSSPLPGVAHDPYVAELLPASTRVRLHWVDGRQALILPATNRAALAFPSSVAPHPALGLALADVRNSDMRPDDVDPAFELARFSPSAEFERLRASVGAPEVPAVFGEAVELVGARWLATRYTPGEVAELLSVWRVIDPERVGPRVPPADRTDIVLFTHVLAGDGAILAQRDELGAPSWQWEAGDVVIQIHALPVPESTPPAEYRTVVGVYDRRSGVRLMPAAGGDTVEIKPLWVNSER